MLQLYESIFLSTVLFKCQSWTNLTNITDTHIESLQTLQMKYLKQTMYVPYSTPNKGTLLELGILPVYDVINCRKLLFLHRILNLKEDDPVLKLYEEQNKLPFEKNWANEVSRLREHYNIMLRDSEIKQIKKEKWRTLIKEKAVAKTFHELKDKLELKTKAKNLTYKSFKRQQHIYKLPATLARIIFKARLSM